MHMSLRAFGAWTIWRALSSKHNYILEFNGPRLVFMHSGTGTKGRIGKNLVYAVRDELASNGWLVPIHPGHRGASYRYSVLDHQQWAAAHPGACEELTRLLKAPEITVGSYTQSGMEEDSFPPSEMAIPNVRNGGQLASKKTFNIGRSHSPRQEDNIDNIHISVSFPYTQIHSGYSDVIPYLGNDALLEEFNLLGAGERLDYLRNRCTAAQRTTILAVYPEFKKEIAI